MPKLLLELVGMQVVPISTYSDHHRKYTIAANAEWISRLWHCSDAKYLCCNGISVVDFKTIGFRSRFSQCVDYMRFNEKWFCFRWQETTKRMLFGNTKTSSLVILCDLRYLTGNISSVMTKHMGIQSELHRFVYLIVQIILCFYS